MPTKIRLQRHGKKRFAYYHVVIADSRAPRDGKFIEKLGTYNPNTNPASIDIDFDKTLDWIKKGAQPTDTVRALLSYKGVIYKNHLDKGVLKGAFSQEEAEKKFDEWMKAKEDKLASKADNLSAAALADHKKRIAAEQEANNKRSEAIAAKNAELAGEEKAAAEEASAVETPAAEATTDAVEAPVAEKVEEIKVEEPKKEIVEEKKAEEPKAEAVEEKKEEAKPTAETKDTTEEKKEA